METYKRVFVIVLDSLGIGAMPDSEKFGDKGVDTFGHILDKMGTLDIPNLQKLGMLNLHKGGSMEGIEKPIGRYMRIGEASNGKDTMTGHWEMMGIYTQKPFITFTETGFPRLHDKQQMTKRDAASVSLETRVQVVRKSSKNLVKKKSIQAQ